MLDPRVRIVSVSMELQNEKKKPVIGNKNKTQRKQKC